VFSISASSEDAKGDMRRRVPQLPAIGENWGTIYLLLTDLIEPTGITWGRFLFSYC